MSLQTTSGPTASWIHRTHPASANPTSANPCSGSHPTSPYAVVDAFLRRFIDAAASTRPATDGRDELSLLLEVEVTEAGYRSLVAPLFYLLNADHRRPTDDEISRHGRWWLDQLP